MTFYFPKKVFELLEAVLERNVASSEQMVVPVIVYTPFVGLLEELKEEDITGTVMDFNEVLAVIPVGAFRDIVKNIHRQFQELVSDTEAVITESWRTVINIPAGLTENLALRKLIIFSYEIERTEAKPLSREALLGMKRLTEEELNVFVKGRSEI